MTIYEYRQNNSGGSFADPAITVYVYANSASEADSIAEENGLYFDGCATGYDCDCCGDRWYNASEWNIVEDIEAEVAGRSKWDTYWAESSRLPLYVIYGEKP